MDWSDWWNFTLEIFPRLVPAPVVVVEVSNLIVWQLRCGKLLWSCFSTATLAIWISISIRRYICIYGMEHTNSYLTTGAILYSNGWMEKTIWVRNANWKVVGEWRRRLVIELIRCSYYAVGYYCKLFLCYVHTVAWRERFYITVHTVVDFRLSTSDIITPYTMFCLSAQW